MNGRERGLQLREAIFKAYEDAQETRRPNRVRPSELGRPCTRSLWYAIRWADKLEKFNGRMLRLFDTGHSQESRLIADLRRIGADVLDRDPADSTKQIAVDDLDGHLKGYIDAMAEKLPFATFAWSPTECKSHNKKSFSAILKDGVEIAKPEHFAQMQVYMHKTKLQEALYLAVNKDDDDIYAEYVSYNDIYAHRLMLKADQVAFSPVAPERINNKPEFFGCRFCKATDVCHNGELPPRNCRTCVEVQPIRDGLGSWQCNLHKAVLTLDQQRLGCPEHRYSPEMVKGRQTDVSADGSVITYERPDGSSWTDTGPVGDTHPPAVFQPA